MKVMNSIFGVDKLSASEFLNASGKLVKFLSESLQDRTSGIIFLRFDCRINSTQEDTHIQRDPF